MQTQATAVVETQPAVPAAQEAPAAAGGAGAAATAQPAAPVAPIAGSPREFYEGAKQQREDLGTYMRRLLNRRDETMQQLRNPSLTQVERQALESHLTTVAAHINQLEQEIQKADIAVARAAAVPGAVVLPENMPRNDGPPEAMFIIFSVFAGVAMVVMAISWARRLWRGATNVVAQIPAAFEQRFTRLEQSLDTVAIEVERVSEGQRFLTKVFADPNARAAMASGGAERSGDAYRQS